MAIKPVEEIPKSHKITQREMIRNDILEALDKGITKFEFIGEYNYRYLMNYAKEEADVIRRKRVKDLQRQFREDNLTDEEKHIDGFYIVKDILVYKSDWIHISSCRGEHQRRVFCEITPFADFEQKVLADCKTRLEEARKRYVLNGNKWERSREQ